MSSTGAAIGPIQTRREHPYSYMVWNDTANSLYHGDSMTGQTDYTESDFGKLLNTDIWPTIIGNGGGNVLVRASSGKYNFSTDIQPNMGSTDMHLGLHGEGRESTIFNYTGSGVNPFYFQSSGANGPGGSNTGFVLLRDFMILVPTPQANQIGLRIKHLTFDIQNLNINAKSLGTQSTSAPPAGSIGVSYEDLGQNACYVRNIHSYQWETSYNLASDWLIADQMNATLSNKYGYFFNASNQAPHILRNCALFLWGGIGVYTLAGNTNGAHKIDHLLVTPFSGNQTIWSNPTDVLKIDGATSFEGSIDLLGAFGVSGVNLLHPANYEQAEMVDITFRLASATNNPLITVSGGASGGQFVLSQTGDLAGIIIPYRFANGDLFVAGQGRQLLGAPSNIASMTITTGGTYQMGGLGGTLTYTPQATGRMRILLSADVDNQTSGPHTVSYKVAYGTGTAPVQGAAATGTMIGANPTYTPPASSALVHVNQTIEIGSPRTSTGALTLGTAYWFDLQLTAQSNSDVIDVKNIEVKLMEW